MTQHLITPLDAQSVIEHLFEAFALHELIVDSQGRPVDSIFLSVNPAFEQMTGKRGQDIIGRRLKQVFPDVDPFWIETFGKVALSGQATTFRRYDEGFGKWWYVAVFCPQPGRFAVLFRDVSEEMRESLENKFYSRLNEALYQLSRATVETEVTLVAEVLKVVLDLTRSELIAFQLRVFSQDRSQSLNLRVDSGGVATLETPLMADVCEHFPPGLHACPAPQAADCPGFDRVLVVCNQSEYCQAVFFKGASPQVLETNQDVLRTFFHELYGLVHQKRLAREKEQLERQFLHAQKLKSLGIQSGIVAHDFNNLLAAILGKIELLKIKSHDPEQLKSELEHLHKLVLQGKGLTTQLLSFVGMDSLEMQSVRLKQLAQDLELLLQTTVPRNIALHTNYGEVGADLSVWADAGRIRQAVMNLVVNAADAIGTVGGDVWLDFHLETLPPEEDWKGLFPTRPGRYVRLSVRDNGPGIPADKLERIFEPFFTTKQGGHGLGLSAVVNIVKEHRGNIRVRSEPGKGAAFDILLPLHEEAAAVEGVVKVDLDHCVDADRPLRVLLIDDEPWLLEVNQETFECLGHRVWTATNGKEGLELFARQDFDLVVLDLTMPGLSGQEVWERMVDVRPDQRFIILTGYSSQALGQEMLDHSHTRFLQKPFELRSLTERLEELFGA